MASAHRVLVTGGSGLLGREVITEFLSHGWSVKGLAFSRADRNPNLCRCDLRQPEEVRKVLNEVRPQVVVHAAAERRPDVTDKDPAAAEALNVGATKTIAEVAGEVGAFVVYISTDYVFDGKAAPYHVDSVPNPLNYYGRSKLEGEKAVRQLLQADRSCVLRVPVLYGDVETLEESAVTVLFKGVLNPNSPAKMNDHQRRYPTHVADVAVVCRQIADRAVTAERRSVSGYLHWSGNECLTKYQMAKRMAVLFGMPSDHVVIAEETPGGTPRPFDCQLDCSDLEKLGIGQRTPFDEGVKRALQKYVQ